MPVHVIVDGYNLSLVCNRGLRAQGPGWREMRESLVRQLSAYSQSKGHPVTVVFDAWRQPGDFEQREHRAGVELVFTREGERADQVIQRLARQYGRDCAVVSSDLEIIQTAEAHGALVMRSHEFQDKLRMAATGAQGAGKGREPAEHGTGNSEDEIPPRRPDKKGNPRKLPKAIRVRNRRLKGF